MAGRKIQGLALQQLKGGSTQPAGRILADRTWACPEHVLKQGDIVEDSFPLVTVGQLLGDFLLYPFLNHDSSSLSVRAATPVILLLSNCLL